MFLVFWFLLITFLEFFLTSLSKKITRTVGIKTSFKVTEISSCHGGYHTLWIQPFQGF